MNDSINQHIPLRHDVRLLGDLLGQTLKEQVGNDFYETVETIRALSKEAQKGDEAAKNNLIALLASQKNSDLLAITRAFSHFLNLANIAENHHRLRRARLHQRRLDLPPQEGSLEAFFDLCRRKALDVQSIDEKMASLSIDLVFTAHPTEVTRRTLMHKYDHITQCLSDLDNPALSLDEKKQIHHAIRSEITASWQTDEIRRRRPTPIDEVKWGLAVIESSLWQALPQHLRELDAQLCAFGARGIPLSYAPIRFSSWMGGDRDGNPHVTADITAQTLLLMRWKAANLYWQDITALSASLSMHDCSEELRQQVGKDTTEPYRELLRGVRDRLLMTQQWTEAKLAKKELISKKGILTHKAQLLEPLLICYRSLYAMHAGSIAEELLVDIIRRVACFGISLVRLDIRQEASKHTHLLAEVTNYLGLGDYRHWTSAERLAFLEQELASKRPLIPIDLTLSPESAEVWSTFTTLAKQLPDTLGAYIISMAKTPADILAVVLLQREARIKQPLRVVPLFETLEDLQQAGSTMATLFQSAWYKNYSSARQEVMIGYSDSTKDAGILAASWAQYLAQETLVQLAKANGFHLTLFHGRGGTVGRGGGPAHLAVLSQPPGSVEGSLRVTEQGEVIRHKYGLVKAAVRSLAVYATATLEATLFPPTAPHLAWRALMNNLSSTSCTAYREVVQDPDFVNYFYKVTPIREIGQFNIGSRPAKRSLSGGIETLRAIPWVFAWTQNRLILPAWLGVGAALGSMEAGEIAQLQVMASQWPYFHAMLSMIEMVLSKASLEVAGLYNNRLNGELQTGLHNKLSVFFTITEKMVCTILESSGLLTTNPGLSRAIAVREPYIYTLNLLQIELLSRSRALVMPDIALESALLVSIAGISAGMRNTG